MYEEEKNYALQGATACDPRQLGQYIPPTARQQLEMKKSQLIAEMDKVQAALAALDAHPDLEEFTETLKKALR